MTADGITAKHVTVRSEPGLSRLLLVECPGLEAPALDDGGEHLRRLGWVVESLSTVCPWVDAVRPGVCTLPIKGPRRYFGTEEAVVARVAAAVAEALGRGLGEGTEAAEEVRLGVAEGVFAAALAARTGTVVAAGETARFLAPWSVDVLGDPELADVLVRLGLSTLGRFAAVPAADVLARFGAAGVRGHRLARGLDGELPGYRMEGMGARLVAALGRALALQDRQPGFWGGASAADERAGEVLTALQRRVGTEVVLVPALVGGRGPADRCRLVSWSPATAVPEPKTPRRKVPPEPPWPGHLPPPAPARVTVRQQTVEVVDDDGTPVGVTARGLLTGQPARLSIEGGIWTPIAAWSAPWPVEERWWSRARRRAARLQVLTAKGAGLLLVTERGHWRAEATYD